MVKPLVYKTQDKIEAKEKKNNDCLFLQPDLICLMIHFRIPWCIDARNKDNGSQHPGTEPGKTIIHVGYIIKTNQLFL